MKRKTVKYTRKIKKPTRKAARKVKSLMPKIGKLNYGWYGAKPRRGGQVKPFKDADKDGVVNWADCKPFNKNEQGLIDWLKKRPDERERNEKGETEAEARASERWKNKKQTMGDYGSAAASYTKKHAPGAIGRTVRGAIAEFGGRRAIENNKTINTMKQRQRIRKEKIKELNEKGTESAKKEAKALQDKLDSSSLSISEKKGALYRKATKRFKKVWGKKSKKGYQVKIKDGEFVSSRIRDKDKKQVPQIVVSGRGYSTRRRRRRRNPSTVRNRGVVDAPTLSNKLL